MKKILVVGGGVNQIPLILASKREGFDVAVVDYAGENCPAFTIADRFYTVSTQDESAVLEIAKKEKVDGIISNSEPSILVVNSIAEKLNLTGIHCSFLLFVATYGCNNNIILLHLRIEKRYDADIKKELEEQT